jgi:hypothetical protein
LEQDFLKQDFRWRMCFSENRCPPRIKCGAGFFRDMRASRLLKKPEVSFRGAPKARARNPEKQEIPMFWIPGPSLRGVPE